MLSIGSFPPPPPPPPPSPPPPFAPFAPFAPLAIVQRVWGCREIEVCGGKFFKIFNGTNFHPLVWYPFQLTEANLVSPILQNFFLVQILYWK
jgi:hypothetical protein